MSIALAILGLAILILVHEMGHMWAARLFGMRVDKFSIFFGPALLRWRGKSTTYQIASVPLGGYVQIAGMNPNEQLPENDPGSYQNKSRLAQFLTVFAGPFVNYLFAIVLVIAVMLVWGLPSWILSVDSTTPGLPAAASGMRPGDRIDTIDGREMHGVDHVQLAIAASAGQPLRFGLHRDGRKVDVQVVPRRVDGGFQIGIVFGTKVRFTEVGAGTALVAGLRYPFKESQKILAGLQRLVTGKVSTKQVGGPVEIVRQLKMSFEASLGTALLFLALLNVYLGLFNLLPLPALDGGRLVFTGVSMIIRRTINPRIENMVHMVGFVLLLGLLLLVTGRDIMRIFG